MTDTQLRIDRARWWALTNQPFYGSLAMTLPDVMDPSCKTAYTNGEVIGWNPSYVEKLTDEEIRYVLLHETLHNGHLHPWRLPADKRGNEAGDHEINLLLNQIEGIKMPEGGLADPQYKDLACEDILGRLPDDEPEDGGGESGGDSDDDSDDQDDESGSGSGDSGDDQSQSPGGGDTSGADDPCGSFTEPPSDPGTSAQAAAQASQELREAWEGRVMQAAQVAQALGVGDIPSDLQRILDKLRNQSVDWRRELADFVKDAMSTRNDWSRAARRHMWQPVIYPRKRNDDVGTVIFARDTSGSINDALCAEFTGLISDCVSEMGCRGIVLDCDTTIQAEYEISSYEECPLTAKGGGGTRFQPVFDKADEMVASGEQVAGIVYLTDMMSGDLGSLMSEIPTLWLATSDWGTEPFGRRVKVETDSLYGAPV